MPESGKHRKLIEKAAKVPFQKVFRVFICSMRLKIYSFYPSLNKINKIILLLLKIYLMQVNIKKYDVKNNSF